MKTISKLTILLIAFLLITSVADSPMVLARTSSGSVTATSSDGADAVRVFPSQMDTSNPEILGPAGSGWKPDVQVGATSEHEVKPSMGSYIDPVTEAVTLYCAMQQWDPVESRWVINVQRSDNRGATWFFWLVIWSTVTGRSLIEPSVAVNPYNGTFYVAYQRTAIGAYSNDIAGYRFGIDGSMLMGFVIDADADDDRNPELVSEYSWGIGNYLFATYEMYWNYDDRDLYFGRSTDQGATWWTYVLQGGADADVYIQSSMTYAQRNLYIAYRHSTDYLTTGHIDVMLSTTYGSSWSPTEEDVSKVPNDASWPSIAGAHIGPAHQPDNVMVAYQYAAGDPTWSDILITWWTQIENKWTGGNDYYHQIATTTNTEQRPKLTIDGMGTEDMSVGGNYHLVYWTSESTPTRTQGFYYTQLPYWDVTLYYGGTYSYTGQALGWSTPKGMIVDDNAWVSASYPEPTITPFKRTVGGVSLWVPGVAWTDYRNPSYDIYFTTPDTQFSITFVPSSQSVVAGKSIAYYVTVNLLGGATAPAYMAVANWITGASWYGVWWIATYSVSPITPTATTTLTITTSNLHPVGTYKLNITATIGGYRRIVAVPYTVTAPPTLTLNISPTSVPKGGTVTFSGQLTPGATTTVYLLYRYPHETGTWKLATTLTTNAAGAYTWTITIPMTAPSAQIDFVAFWVSPSTGSYATSPIKILTIT